MSQATVSVHSQASLVVEACVLPRAQWLSERRPDGGFRLHPVKETWYGHVVRGRSSHDVRVVPVIGCPGCNTQLFLVHDEANARRVGLKKPIHQINHLGKVSPDIHCNKCGFHRKVYLDRWHKTKALYAVAYVRRGGKTIEIEYCHAIDQREALFHMGFKPGEARVIASGPAVGFYVDDRTGRITAEG